MDRSVRHRRVARLAALAALAVAALGLAAAAPASADPVAICNSGAGIVHASPGVRTTAHAQRVLVAGTLSDCTGGLTRGLFVAKFTPGPAFTCADLQTGGGSISGKLAVVWSPRSNAASLGSITVALGAGGTAHVTGSISKGTGKGLSFSADAQLTPKFKPRGTPCSEANKLQWAKFTLTSPLVAG